MTEDHRRKTSAILELTRQTAAEMTEPEQTQLILMLVKIFRETKPITRRSHLKLVKNDD